MPTNSRAKGRRAERDVAKLLAKWWGKVDPKCEFKPTPLSGGWGGRDGGAHVRAHFKASGDLMTTGVHFPFTVEVKHREAWSARNLFAGRATPVWDWWIQAERQAAEEDGIPMLWFRKNKLPWMVGLPPLTLRVREIKPDFYVSRGMLTANGVELGDEVPAFIMGERLLGLDPHTFAKED